MRGSYVARAVSTNQSENQAMAPEDESLLTFHAKASIPSPPSVPVILKVSRHVYRAFLEILRDLAIPGRLQTLRLWAV